MKISGKRRYNKRRVMKGFGPHNLVAKELHELREKMEEEKRKEIEKLSTETVNEL